MSDAELLRRIIEELHAYATSGPRSDKPRLGVLFRAVGAGDRQAIYHKLVDFFGPAGLLDNLALYGVDDDYHYVFDSESVTHVWNRHTDPIAEQQHGQLPLEVTDLGRIPTVVRPGNIVEFAVVKGTPRIVFAETANEGRIVVVLEIQRGRRWLVVRTAYKRK
jgi:hypothetical protein